MNRNDDFNHTLEAWLRREAPSQAPDRVLESALERVATESQRRSWLQRLLGETPMATLTRVAALTAVIAVAVLVGLQLNNLIPDVGDSSPSPTITEPSPSATPYSSLPAACVSLPDIETLADLIGPGGSPVDCYGNALLTFDGEIIAGVADCPGAGEPLWLSCPQTFLRLVGETRKIGAPMMSVAVDPASGVSLGDPNTNVRVTGHFDDPAAQTCQLTEPSPGQSLDPVALSIEPCRQHFVVTEAVPLVANPTGTIALVGGVVDGPGVSVSEAMAGAPMEQVLVNGRLLIDGFGIVWLCETLEESTPPRFGGARLRVENYSDGSSTGFQEVDGVRWLPDSIQLFGNVSVP
jgi:hypothetical protein